MSVSSKAAGRFLKAFLLVTLVSMAAELAMDGAFPRLTPVEDEALTAIFLGLIAAVAFVAWLRVRAELVDHGHLEAPLQQRAEASSDHRDDRPRWRVTAGMDGYLSKPIDRQALLTAIEQVLPAPGIPTPFDSSK